MIDEALGICASCSRRFALHETHSYVEGRGIPLSLWRCHWCGYQHGKDEAQHAMISHQAKELLRAA